MTAVAAVACVCLFVMIHKKERLNNCDLQHPKNIQDIISDHTSPAYPQRKKKKVVCASVRAGWVDPCVNLRTPNFRTEQLVSQRDRGARMGGWRGGEKREED